MILCLSFLFLNLAFRFLIIPDFYKISMLHKTLFSRYLFKLKYLVWENYVVWSEHWEQEKADGQMAGLWKAGRDTEKVYVEKTLK